MFIFAPDWTGSNLIMARDVFANMSNTKATIAGATIGGSMGAMLAGLQDDSAIRDGLMFGAVGGLSFRNMSRIFGHKLSRDIIRGTPLDRIHRANQASPALMQEIVSDAQKAWKGSKQYQRRLVQGQATPHVDFRDPEFLDFFLKHGEKELAKKKKFIPDEFTEIFFPTTDLPGLEMRARMARNYAIRATGAYFVMAAMANYAFTGHLPFDNSPGHRHEIELPYTDQKGRKQYMSLGKQFKEPLEWVHSPFKRLSSKTSLGFRVTMDIMKNADFMGAPIYGHEDGLIWQTNEEAAPLPFIGQTRPGGKIPSVMKYASQQAFTPAIAERMIAASQSLIDPRTAALNVAGFMTKTEFLKGRGGKKQPKGPLVKRVGRRGISANVPLPPALAPTSLRPGER
jgi:hypothetical protein